MTSTVAHHSSANSSVNSSVNSSANSSAQELPPPTYLPNQASLDFLWQSLSEMDNSDILLSHSKNLEIQLHCQYTLLSYLRESLPYSIPSHSIPNSVPSRYSFPSHSVPSRPNSVSSHSVPSHSVPSQPNSSYLQPLTPELKETLAKEGKCFRCRQPGHVSFSSACPNNQWKPKQKQRNKRN